jgi:c-di-GMP-related signal transduction protein
MAGHANDLFLLGLLSVMDAILNQPLDKILSELPIRREIKGASQALSGLYRDVLNLAIVLEGADWEAISPLAPMLGIKEDQIPALYFSAVD